MLLPCYQPGAPAASELQPEVGQCPAVGVTRAGYSRKGGWVRVDQLLTKRKSLECIPYTLFLRKL